MYQNFYGQERIYESLEMAYGDYVVIESSVPDNLHPVKPFIVHISEDSRESQA